ncbi:MAG TPA: shikimate dehydrogenase [Bryobacteraceae bacterium]|nr:shikimate dehydrogenase [Bryobacteraceae bacterium]
MPSLPRSLPRICVALGSSTSAELGRAAEREYKDGNTFLEFRLDYLSDPFAGVEVIQHLLASYPDAAILATCRHKQNHGRFGGSLEKQIAVLHEAAKHGATAVDLEVESAEQMKPAVAQLREVTPVVLSYHNFESTPALDPVLRRLQRIPADAYKMAVTARKPGDNLRLVHFLKEHRDVPLIALAMSEVGAPTRILAPALGCVYTYAAPNDGDGTAPGQITARAMRTLFRSDKLTKHTRVYGVIADPVAHSKSPAIHNRAFQARRIDAVYLPFLVAPAQLTDWMKMALALPVAGFSVTIPHKQRILRHLDVVEPLAKRIGAVNTVWRKGGKWRGANTDTQGVIKPLLQHLRLAHATVLIAGYGGAARAAAVALADAGANVTVTGRNLKSAQALAQVVKADAIPLQESERQQFDVLLHATPVGMYPAVDESLFPGKIPAALVFDMVYNPHETLLLKRAKAQGCTIIHGAEMLLQQAVAQFEIWTGESAPCSVMEMALEQSSS